MTGSAFKVFFVVGEESGDQLGARLIAALRTELGERPLELSGTGGERMAKTGLASLFPISDVAVMGLTAVIARAGLLKRRIRETAAAALVFAPDVMVLIDSPGFTHRVAKAVRAANPSIPIIDYVCPSVWAWKPGRAKKMLPYIDHVLAILPFEPKVLKELGGPAGTYVGHPILERRMDRAAGAGADAGAADHFADPPRLLVLPGSRRSETSRLLAVFGEVVGDLVRRGRSLEVIVPAVSHLADEIEAATKDWAAPVRIVRGEDEKFREFERATAALAASGTVTLELALAGTPMVVAYRLDFIYSLVFRYRRFYRWLIMGTTMVLVNVILGHNVVPEYLDDEVVAGDLAAALEPLLEPSPVRDAQIAAFSTLDDLMRLPDGKRPSVKAAEMVIALAVRQQG